MRELIIADTQDVASLGVKYLATTLEREISEIIVVHSKADLIELLISKPEALVVVDYTLLDFSGVNEFVIIRTRFAKSDWIVFSDDLNDHFLRQTVYNEPSFSILLKSCSQEEISLALYSVAKGQRFICNEIANHLLTLNHSQVKNEHTLTATERDVLREIALGKTTKEIAVERFISVHTVVSHRKNIFRKLGVNNVHEATKYAIKAGLIDISDYYI